MNRAQRRVHARNERRALRALHRGDPWANKLAAETLILNHIGALDDAGRIRCPDCGAQVPRNDGWHLDVTCSCGWRLVDDEAL